MGIGRLRFCQEFTDTQRGAVADVCFDVRQFESKTGADWHVTVLGINRRFEFFDCDDYLEFVEVRDATSCVATKPSCIADTFSRAFQNVSVQRQ